MEEGAYYSQNHIRDFSHPCPGNMLQSGCLGTSCPHDTCKTVVCVPFMSSAPRIVPSRDRMALGTQVTLSLN